MLRDLLRPPQHEVGGCRQPVPWSIDGLKIIFIDASQYHGQEACARNARSYSFLAAIIFTVVALVQLMRAVLGWSLTADMGSGPMVVPLWPSWIVCVVFAVLAWLGFTASRNDQVKRQREIAVARASLSRERRGWPGGSPDQVRGRP